MGSKKKVVKKKLQKKLQKKVVKHDKVQELKDKMKKAMNGDLSKLEYEQSLLDPRFKAAMMGFNQPSFPFANQAIHNLETKNNELTRKITTARDMIILKQAIERGKSELNETKEQGREELEKQKYKQKKVTQDNELKRLKSKQERDMANAQHQLTMAEGEQEYINKIHPTNQNINNLNNELSERKQKHEYDKNINNLNSQQKRLEFEAVNNPQIEVLQLQIQALSDKIDETKNIINSVKTFKSLIHKKKSLTNKIKAQKKNAKIETDNDKMEAEIQLNKESHELEKQEHQLKVKNQLLQQEVDPAVRDEIREKTTKQEMKNQQLRKANDLMKNVEKAIDEADQTRIEIAKMGAIIWGKDFNIKMLNEPNFEQKLYDKLVEKQNELTTLQNQVASLQTTQDIMKRTKDLQVQKVALEHQGELITVENEAAQQATLNHLKQQREIAAATQTNANLSQFLNNFKAEHWNSIVKTEQDYHRLMDEVPVFYSAANEVAKEYNEPPSVKHLTQTLQRLETDEGKLAQLASLKNETNQLKQAMVEKDTQIARLNDKIEKDQVWYRAKCQEAEEKQKIINQGFRLYGQALNKLTPEQRLEAVYCAGGADSETAKKIDERAKVAFQEYSDNWSNPEMFDENNVFIPNKV